MSDKPDDFERILEAYQEGFRAATLTTELSDPECERRGVLAALREMRESDGMAARFDPANAVVARELWQSMLDELIRQGEQQGPGAD